MRRNRSLRAASRSTRGTARCRTLSSRLPATGAGSPLRNRRTGRGGSRCPRPRSVWRRDRWRARPARAARHRHSPRHRTSAGGCRRRDRRGSACGRCRRRKRVPSGAITTARGPQKPESAPLPLSNGLPLRREHLDPVIPRVGDEDASIRCNRNAHRVAEVARFVARCGSAPHVEDSAVGGELLDAMVLAVRDIERSVGGDGDPRGSRNCPREAPGPPISRRISPAAGGVS